MKKEKSKKSVTDRPDFQDYVAVDAVCQLCELFHKTMQMSECQPFSDEDIVAGSICTAPTDIMNEIVRQIFKVCEDFFNDEREADENGND